MFTCCHPALSREAGVALTLRTIAGLSTVEIARAFLLPDATMGQRISRAKKKIEVAKIPYRIPSDHELPDRLAGVLAVLNVVFTVGHHAPVGRLDERVDLADEGIRLTRMLANLMPDEPEVWGLLALMLATHARRDTRVDSAGDLILMPDQDRTQWHPCGDRRGDLHPVESAATPPARALPDPGRDRLFACSSLDVRRDRLATDHRAVSHLERLQPTPVVTVNRAVAESRAWGPQAGLAVLDSVRGVDRWHLYWATRAALLAESGDPVGAKAAYRSALECEPNESDTRFLRARLAALS